MGTLLFVMEFVGVEDMVESVLAVSVIEGDLIDEIGDIIGCEDIDGGLMGDMGCADESTCCCCESRSGGGEAGFCVDGAGRSCT